MMWKAAQDGEDAARSPARITPAESTERPGKGMSDAADIHGKGWGKGCLTLETSMGKARVGDV